MHGRVPQLICAQVPRSNHSKHLLELIQCEYGSRRVVDCRRQSAKRNVDYNAKGKRRILIQSALGAEYDAATEHPVVDSCRFPIQMK